MQVAISLFFHTNITLNLTSILVQFSSIFYPSTFHLPPSCPAQPATPSAPGLGISLDQVKTVLQATQQFIFTDGTVNGQPASTATLGSGAAASFPAIANGFSAQFIGDPCNIRQLTLSLPRNDQQDTVD
jgi:hypothetical protein